MNPKHFFICLLTFANSLATDLTPWKATPLSNPARKIFPFRRMWVQNWDTFLLSKDQKILYVGARDTIVALDIRTAISIRLKNEIHWSPTADKKDSCGWKVKNKETECLNFIRVLVQLNDTHLYTCGTYAFSPTCAYVDLTTFTLVKDTDGKPLLVQGKAVSPYSPHYGSTAVLVDGELYTATMENFLGNHPVITRTLGSSSVLKNEHHWMSDDATFVASFNIPTPPNDDKVYFFFWETAKEFDFFEKMIVSRVARICKNDVGGKKLLQKKWTTFLKAHLSCSQKGQFPYNVIQHMFVVPHPGGSAFFYGVFVPQWQVGNLWTSAVCIFDLSAINQVFDNGRYKDLHKDCFRWLPYEGEVPDPHPGSCSVSPPDKTLMFIKEHYLMDQIIQPLYNQPVFVKHNVKYTRITVHKTENTLGISYTLLFLGTEAECPVLLPRLPIECRKLLQPIRSPVLVFKPFWKSTRLLKWIKFYNQDQGAIHKVVLIGSEAHLIEEIQLFDKSEAVQNLLLSPEKGILYVGYSRGIIQVPLANCGIHKTCPDCILARDPYCAWDGRKCSDSWNNKYKSMAGRSYFKQDVENGNTGLLCMRSSGRSSGKSKVSSKSITLIAVVAVVFFCCPETVKAKSRVQGCRIPLTAPTPAMSTCSIQAIRANKNCLDLGLPNWDDFGGVVAAEGI